MISLLKNILSKHQDKALHFIVCAFTVLVSCMLFNTAWPGIILAFTWGVWKESRDPIFDSHDLLADMLGILFAFLLWRFFNEMYCTAAATAWNGVNQTIYSAGILTR